MELAEKGMIGTLIVKDHSRLGRNRLIVGQLLEEEFDRLGVRYIAIMDNIDTAKGISDLVPMQDLFNEWHAKNTSQKVRNVFRNKGMSGAPLATNPPYGYRKSPESTKQNDQWIVDETAAETVRQIFGWCRSFGSTDADRPKPGSSAPSLDFCTVPTAAKSCTTEIKELTPELIHEFIDRIVVYAPKYLDGKRYQVVDVYYSGVGILRELSPEEMEEAFQKRLAKEAPGKEIPA